MKKNASKLWQVLMDILVGVGTYTIFAKTVAKMLISIIPESWQVSVELSVLIGFTMVALFAEFFEIKSKE